MIITDKTGTRGTATLHRFENGYGASVITDGYGSELGLQELAVIKWEGDEFKITYVTPITDDVLGYLDPEEVAGYLTWIESLTPADIRAEKVRRNRARIEELRRSIAQIEAEIEELEASE